MDNGNCPDLANILSGSLQAKKEGNYRKVYQARRQLEKVGFSWSENHELLKSNIKNF